MFHNHEGLCFGAKGHKEFRFKCLECFRITVEIKKFEVFSKKAGLGGVSCRGVLSVESPALSHVSTFRAKD